MAQMCSPHPRRPNPPRKLISHIPIPSYDTAGVMKNFSSVCEVTDTPIAALQTGTWCVCVCVCKFVCVCARVRDEEEEQAEVLFFSCHESDSICGVCLIANIIWDVCSLRPGRRERWRWEVVVETERSEGGLVRDWELFTGLLKCN